MSEDDLAMVGRYESVIDLIEGDRIWPVTVSVGRRTFGKALKEVLSRLPEEVFDRVEDEIGFVLEDPFLEMFAVNVPAPESPRGKLGRDNIVFFQACLKFPLDALIGLIAHEIAHSFVSGNDYRTDEALVIAKAREWGFGSELDCLEPAKVASRVEASS
jgi:hypothetical protein